MAYTEQDLAAVNAAIVALASGQQVTEIRFADRSVKYHDASAAELRALKAEIIAAMSPQRAPFAGRTWLAVQAGRAL